MLSTKSIRITSYVVMTYILVAITWWAVLLHREHDALYDAYEAIHEQQLITTNPKLETIRNMETGELHKKRHRKTVMILSEALFIGLGLLIGLWVINNGYRNLVKAERVKQNFLLSISHELKSPIASAKLAFESLMRLTKTDAQGALIVEQGLKETNRLHELVKNILLATKLETGYLPEFQSLNLGEQVENLINSQLMQYPKANINLTVSPNPLVEKLDAQAFDIVSHNLIENAIKYSADGDPIQVRLERKNDVFNFSVADQGVGIHEDEKLKIFDRFYRIGEESKRKSKGTGLGLYLVKELVHKNNGTITIQNNTPNGVVFNVNWPIIHSTQSI